MAKNSPSAVAVAVAGVHVVVGLRRVVARHGARRVPVLEPTLLRGGLRRLHKRPPLAPRRAGAQLLAAILRSIVIALALRHVVAIEVHLILHRAAPRARAWRARGSWGWAWATSAITVAVARVHVVVGLRRVVARHGARRVPVLEPALLLAGLRRLHPRPPLAPRRAGAHMLAVILRSRVIALAPLHVAAIKVHLVLHRAARASASGVCSAALAVAAHLEERGLLRAAAALWPASPAASASSENATSSETRAID